MNDTHGTTVIAVKRDGHVVMGADGQVTFGATVLKANAQKVRFLYNDRVLTGFAGSTADAFTLFERFEGKLKEYNGNLLKSAVELAKDWRTEKVLRRLEAMLIVADREHVLLLSGTGDVIEPEHGIAAIGSGGPYALAAARALIANTDMAAKGIVTEALKIASDICIYTNSNFVIKEL